ncbi:ABC transporter permease [Bacteroidia bacterium]|nr:ABC transporter permease [Bacteroidia bacterium]
MIKNFLFSLKHYKTSSILNILGLSVAFTVFIIILMQVEYDYNFDKFHKDNDRIYRVDFVDSDNSKQAIINRPLAEVLFQSSPHIVAGALTNPASWNTLISVEKNGSQFTSTEPMTKVSADLIQVLPFDIVEGSENALKEPNGTLIPLSLAQKLFGNETAIGKEIMENRSVQGVYRDFPVNSSIQNCIYYSFGDENISNYGNWNYYTYVLLDSPDAIADVRESMKQALVKLWQQEGAEESEIDKMSFELTSLPNLHFTTDVQWDYLPKASRQTLFVLLSIAIAIVLIAGINFTNFSMALVPRRIRSINTQKVLGASVNRLRARLASEAVFISLAAYGLALLLVHLASQTPINELLDSGIHLFSYPALLGTTALVAVSTGILSGLYPAFYITSFQPALALKGSFGLSPQGQKLRNLLIGIQFVASFVLIIAALFMYFQNNYLKNRSLGFNKEGIIVTDITNSIKQNYDVFGNELKSFAGIEEVTYGEQLLGSSDTYMGWGRNYQGKQINFQCIPVHPSFLPVMGIKVNEGRDFREDDSKTRHGKYIFNEKAQKEFDIQLNTDIDSTEIIGFMPDVQFTTFRTAPTPMAFYVWGNSNWGDNTRYAYIKVSAGSDLREAMQHVRKTLSKLDPDWTFNVRFYDDAIQHVYEKEQHLTLLISLFSAIAILISITGVFGLVVFETAYRRKEISIRKVHGSSVGEIVSLFNKMYLVLLGICFLIACPITYYAVSKWLENFAYKTPVYWWVFLLGGVIVSVITLITVNGQSYRAATQNPTKALNSD